MDPGPHMLIHPSLRCGSQCPRWLTTTMFTSPPVRGWRRGGRALLSSFHVRVAHLKVVHNTAAYILLTGLIPEAVPGGQRLRNVSFVWVVVYPAIIWGYNRKTEKVDKGDQLAISGTVMTL